jgi:mannose-1-phosphate guanylyltransferase
MEEMAAMFSVIMAGGSGTRFWPASRERLPKQFLKITSNKTMFEETLERVRHFSSDAQIFTVVGAQHEELVRQSSTLNGEQILVEPCARNTAAAIGLAAIHVARIDPSLPMVVLPADHFIGDVPGFVETIRKAGEAARSGGIVTIGITPTRPETGYGYIRIEGTLHDDPARENYRMDRFVEKPNRSTAIGYISDRRHLWNSGIFLFTPLTILAEIENHLPQLAKALQAVDSAIETAEYASVLAREYAVVEGISIDYGVMERTTTPVTVFKGDFGWSDVGSWQALYELRSGEYDSSGNLAIGDGQIIDSQNSLVYSMSDRLVALLGVEDIMVIDTPDALLVARLDRSQDVKSFPARLKESGRDEF